ncbi:MULTISPECIES: hypothetical protein [Ruegeria]|uniref:hypothetical protein n=1 Tax=Ruegeria TaxID=97050 RepID=UPI0014798677|nr:MULTISPECIES: hypothetical protein [Ruegeria]
MIEAKTTDGVNVKFKPSQVMDWSVNNSAEATLEDPELEVVFSRGLTEELTQRVYFSESDAARVALALVKHKWPEWSRPSSD